ncbi:NAD(P)-binding protein [Fistulina hepatica ATCC 64428]|uniref:D-xylose 1-dehydrogenase (NADP(+), D-xylono-1,5-lactone-forming) n=1 Tax=Fistulina hepatica ATCC 64428 TaxID=1128425 RepID=A0A0D7A3Q7_9AGAR|nr:NAD(P)-binding protein [Fistulina hepatica ATCC 64428]
MSSLVGLITRLYKLVYPPGVHLSTDPKPLKFGILGAAAIAPFALISPAKSHPEAVVYGVAARDRARADVYAKKHGIPKVYGSYEELLDDPEIDVVYNPLPNALHYEWTVKILLAGKHCLLEKPATDTLEESQKLFELAESKNLVLMEAFHYRFHPAIQRVKQILDSGELGPIRHITASLALPQGIVGAGDIRYVYSLGGGSMMDAGCYTLSCVRYLVGSAPTSVIATATAASLYKPDENAHLIDGAVTATLAFPNDVTATITSDEAMPHHFGFIPRLPQVYVTVKCEGGEVKLYNFVMPTIYHYITVTPRDGKSRTEKAYTFKDGKGEEWWATYRYQLEAFVDRLRGRTPQTWVDKEDTLANMEWIEKIYETSGLGARPKSQFTF